MEIFETCFESMAECQHSLEALGLAEQVPEAFLG